MSAWLVSGKTLSLIAKTFYEFHHDDSSSVESLFEKLLEMNLQALDERYGGGHVIEEITFIRKHHTEYTYQEYGEVSKIEIYKRICCYLYQCSEGSVPDLDFFKKVSDIKSELAEEIIHELKEFEDGPWE